MTKPYFTVTGIPEQLGLRPDGNRRTLTLGEIETIMWCDRQFVIPVAGDCMEALAIFGVIYASWDADGRLLWKREPESFTDALVTTPTICGGNIVDPVPVRRAAV